MQRFIWSCLLFLSLINLTHAQGNWFIGAGAGATFPRVDNNHYIASGVDGWPHDRYHNNSVDTAALLAVETGYQWIHEESWLPFYQVGLNYTYEVPTKVQGKVEQYGLPEFTNYHYQYKIQSQTLLAIFKVDLYRWCNFMPFLSAGAGIAINNASNYAEKPLLDVLPRVNPGFNGETNTHFSYAFGAGFDYILSQNFWLSLKYEYAYQGHAQTSTGANIPMLTATNYANDRLETKLSSNSVLFSLNYFIDCVA